MNTNSSSVTLQPNPGSLPLALCVGGVALSLGIFFLAPWMAVILFFASQLAAFILGLTARRSPRGLAAAIASGTLLLAPLLMCVVRILSQK